MTYPEHEKMAAKQDEIDAVTDFLEWLGANKYLVLRPYSPSGKATNRLDECNWPSIERLLAEHFAIDPKTLDAEKAAMLAELRSIRLHRGDPA